MKNSQSRDEECRTSLIKFAVPITKNSFCRDTGVSAEEVPERISLPASRRDGSTALRILTGKVRTVVARGSRETSISPACVVDSSQRLHFQFPASTRVGLESQLQELASERKSERERERKRFIEPDKKDRTWNK